MEWNESYLHQFIIYHTQYPYTHSLYGRVHQHCNIPVLLAKQFLGFPVSD